MSGGFTCVSCGGTTARHWRVEGAWQIVRCQGCGLLATWPRPDADTLRALYESACYYDERSMGAPAHQPWLSRTREILGALPSAQGPMLDFGAGSGGLVHAARALGVEADGIEPSATARELARSLYGIDLAPSLEPGSDRRYGAITLLHVLEHVPDPLADLQALRPLLTPSGIVFIEVPHAGSADMWVPSRRRAILDPPAHLHHFTPKTLRTLLANSGYDVVDVRLFNAAPLERALAWRAAHREPRGRVPTIEAEGVTASARTARIWPRLLEAVRAVCPGAKFQIVARAAR